MIVPVLHVVSKGEQIAEDTHQSSLNSWAEAMYTLLFACSSSMLWCRKRDSWKIGAILTNRRMWSHPSFSAKNPLRVHSFVSKCRHSFNKSSIALTFSTQILSKLSQAVRREKLSKMSSPSTNRPSFCLRFLGFYRHLVVALSFRFGSAIYPRARVV